MKKIISMFLQYFWFLDLYLMLMLQTLKCQTVLTQGHKVKMLKDFTDITTLTSGSLKFEIIPAGSVVGVKETLDAVDKSNRLWFRMDSLLVRRSPSSYVIWFTSSWWWSRY